MAEPPVFALFHDKGKLWLLSLLHGGHTPGPYMGPWASQGAWEKSGVEKEVLLTDISSQDIFYLFLLESSFDYQLVVTIYWTTNWKEKINYLICRCEALKQIRNMKQGKDVFKKSTARIALWRKKMQNSEVFRATSYRKFCPGTTLTCLSHGSEQDHSLGFGSFPLYLLTKMFSPQSPSTAVKCREKKPHVPAHV